MAHRRPRFPVSMHSSKRRGRALAVAAVIGLLAAACGSDSEPIDTAAGGQATVDDATAETTSGTDRDSATEAPDPSADAPAADADGEEAEAAGPAPVDDNHSFPDLNTVNIADGSSLNLAQQLAGGDTPVMLWFFAPH